MSEEYDVKGNRIPLRWIVALEILQQKTDERKHFEENRYSHFAHNLHYSTKA